MPMIDMFYVRHEGSRVTDCSGLAIVLREAGHKKFIDQCLGRLKGVSNIFFPNSQTCFHQHFSNKVKNDSSR